ncbi:MAG: galactose-1-epimerase [Aliivibrio sp.]|uniref:galactose-1-epimerase n=1 Tax=Aliivibrio sp. TaxID=1872443 RepID=UPI001A525C8C|nr:galactose-1-epimerase [Aliivibrio sp.]
MDTEPFTDGKPANVYTLHNQLGSKIAVMDIGATWLSCQLQVDQQIREVLLGVDTMAKHQQQEAYLGATVGRYANRIAGGKFVIGDKNYQVAVNQGGNCLHGGVEGFDKRRWALQELRSDCVVLSLHSADGEQGFPGNLEVTVSYQLTDQNEVVLAYSGMVDKACPVNLTNHAYFNLMGDESSVDGLEHQLQIFSAHYAATNEVAIPIGKLKSVVDSGFDFNQLKPIKQDFLRDFDQQLLSGYDHSLLLDSDKTDGQQVAARLVSADKQLTMEVRTSKPAIQLYSGNFLQGTAGRQLHQYSNHQGIALETQFLPDSPNHPEWPHVSSILQPEQTYQAVTKYKFIVS